jgi:excisionase family DNA binding protein
MGRKILCNLVSTMTESTITPRVLKTKDAALYLSISAWKLRNLVQSGEIPCILGDGTSPWLFDIQDLDNWIERRKQTL